MPDALGQHNYQTMGVEHGEKRLLIHHIPGDVLDKFKAACARQGLPMRKVVLEFMNKYAQIHLSKPFAVK